MIVSGLRVSVLGDWARLSAEVVHEVASVPYASLYVEVPAARAAFLREAYDAFAVGCMVPAIAHRETRLVMEGEICPKLRDGIGVAMRWYRHWYGPRWTPIPIEAPARREERASSARRGAIYFSCGIDSLYSLRRLLQRFPAEHPSRPEVALFVIGYDLRKPLAVERALANAAAASAALGLDLLPIRSNIPSLDDDYSLWQMQFGGPGFVSLAHGVGAGIERAWLAADCDIPNLVPWCNHPATIPELSSYSVEIHQDGIEATRAQKAGAIADWPIAQRHLRVCTRNPERELNCGVCEKCVRTRLELLAFGGADSLAAFGSRPLVAEDVLGIRIRMDSIYYDEVIPGLRERGRDDLIAAIGDRKREWTRYKRWRDRSGIAGRVLRRLGL